MELSQLSFSNSHAYASFRNARVMDLAEMATNLTGVNQRPRRKPATPKIARHSIWIDGLTKRDIARSAARVML
jgi:hypothetical protein